MAKSSALGKSIVLIVLIIILCLGGLLWFDYLGILHVKTLFAPVYKTIGMQPQTSTTASSTKPIVADLDQDRLNKIRESLDLYKEDLEKRDENVSAKELQNEQIASEIENREKSLEEREKTFNNTVKKYDDREVNIVQIAANLEGMQPRNAVNILVAMDDQMIIDVLRKVEERAVQAGTSSMVAYWLSLMDAGRAAEVQRKMASKPLSLD